MALHCLTTPSTKQRLGKFQLTKMHSIYLHVLVNFASFTEAHQPEHSLEIQLPFLQKTVESFQLVPLVIGRILEENYVRNFKTIKQNH